MIDARRREVFVPGPRAVAPDDLELEAGTICIGERRGALPGDARGHGRVRSAGRRRAARPARAPARVARAGVRPGRGRRSRSTSARRTRRCGAPRERQLRRLERATWTRSRDRARVLPDAVVALDVRGRAAEAERARARRLPRGHGRARRLRVRLPLRRRVARDEPRGRAGAPPARDRELLLRARLRADGGRPAPRLHAGGARLERRGDPALRAARIRGPRHPAGLLHRQP